jgi:hypothetical protein
MEGMMGPSTPIDRITAKSSMFGVPGTTPGEQVIARENLQQKATQTLGGAQSFLGDFLSGKRPGLGRTAFIGGMIPGIMEAGSELQAGRPTGALAALGAGALTSAAGAALLKAPFLPAKLAGGALLLGSSLIPGASAQIAESTLQSLTGKPTKGKEEEFSTQLAMRGQIMNQNLDMLNRDYATQLNNLKDLTQFMNAAQVQQYKAMAPELEKTKMNDFARYQTAMALQGQIQGRLGTLATAGALAQGAQAGSYATTDTILRTNPYAQATLQAPQIRFG